MFIFAIFVQKIDFDWSQFRRMGVTLTEFYWFKFSSLPVLEESCFPARKVTLDEYFYHWNDHFYYFCSNVIFELFFFVGEGTGWGWGAGLGLCRYNDNIIVFWIFRISGIFWVEYWTGGNMPIKLCTFNFLKLHLPPPFRPLFNRSW